MSFNVWHGITGSERVSEIAPEEALKASEEKYKKLYDESKRAAEVYDSLLHTCADAIIIYDMKQRVIYINPPFTRIFGWEREEVMGKRLDFVPAPVRPVNLAGMARIAENGEAIQGFETQRQLKGGRIIDVSISGSRYNDHTGNPAGILTIIRDISEQKKLELQFQQAQRMEAMGTLAGGIAHDFNNLLMGIQGRTALMAMDKDPSHPDFEHIKGIEEYLKNAALLTQQLLGFARGGIFEVKPTDINDLVARTAGMFGRTKKEITIHSDYQERIWTVEADRGQMDQVFMNLFVNAWQAMPEGGELFLETKNVVFLEKDAKLLFMAPGKYVKISITDTGAGVDAANQGKIFDPFFTTKEMGRGTGLGLASTYGIIKNHSGMINVFSEKGKGATFNIYLPASGGEIIKENEPDEEPLRGTETVLLVDDEDVILEVLELLLGNLGCKVLTARSGKEAIETYEKNRDQVDLVILDMIMPDMNGGECYDRLKALDPDLKVLLSSGYSCDGQAAEILERGCNGFIQKPFDVTQLSRKLREILK